VAFGPFVGFLIGFLLANLSTLVVYALCCLAAGALRRRGVRMGGTPFRVPAAGAVIVLACLVIGWMLTSVTAGEWTAFGIATAAASTLTSTASVHDRSPSFL